MNQYTTAKVSTLEKQSEKICPSTHRLRVMDSNSMVQVVAELRLLSKELELQQDISEKILDSVHVLVQSLEEQL